MSNGLTFYERQKLQYWLRSKQSIRTIAKVMRKDHSVLSREIRRNGASRKRYRADTAQALSDKRRRQRRRGKLDKNLILKQYVVDRLKDDWSPEEIAGRLKKVSANETNGATISHESIYYYIYNKDGRYEGLYKYLRQGKSKKRKRHSRKNSKLRIPERKSIRERPGYIDERKRYGDWESDSVIFSNQKGILSVQSERKSRLIRLHKAANKSADETNNALIKTAESISKFMFKTITFDNGTENAKHIEIKKEYDIETYFCDPFASWQKGGVENANKLIRQYLPRKTDLSELTDRSIYLIQEKLNNRPRKRLNYKTPNEVINNYLKSGALIT